MGAISLFMDMIHWLKFIVLCELFFSFSRKRYSKRMITAFIIALSASLITLILPVTIISLVIYILAVWGVFMVIYDEKKGILLFTGVWSMFLIALLDEMTYTSLSAYIITDTMQKTAFAKFCTQIFTLLFLLFTGYLLRKRGRGKIKKIGLPYMMIFTVLVIADAYVLMILGNSVVEIVRFKQDIYFRIAYSIVVFSTFFQILLVLLLIVSRNEAREKERIAQKYLENQIEHYQYLEHRESETKRFRHDLKSHMYALQSYLQKQQYKEMEQHLTEMYGTMTEFEKNISVNNNIVDAILNKCNTECKQQGIQFAVKGHFPIACELSAYDLCTIFSNLLANAQEAARKGSTHQIFVGIRYTDDELIFHFENDYAGEVLVKEGKISTTKQNANYHGMGLLNVEKCVEKNHGIMHIQTENQRFIVKVNIILQH